MSGLVPESPDVESPVLRLFRFRPTRPEFDAILREVMLPDLATQGGLRWALVGRQGPGQMGERLVASLWSSRAAMVDAVGADFERPVFHPEFLPATEDRRLDFAPVSVALGDPTLGEARIVRLVVGATLPGRSAEYLERAAIGAASDVATGHGPVSVHLSMTGPDAFVTLSTWADWSMVAKATGTSIADPDMTRHRDLLERWHAEHYELASIQRPVHEATAEPLPAPRLPEDPPLPETEDVA